MAMARAGTPGRAGDRAALAGTGATDQDKQETAPATRQTGIHEGRPEVGPE